MDVLDLDRYQLWIKNAFDRPYTAEKPWYFDSEQEEFFELLVNEAIPFYHRLFQNCKSDLKEYTEGQIADGLSSLLNNSAGHDMFLIIQDGFNQDALRQMIKAIPTLYKDIFYKFCQKEQEHEYNYLKDRIENICIMWWDADIWIFSLQQAFPDRFTADFAAMFESILSLQHYTIQYSALHGLGHFYFKGLSSAAYVERIIDQAIERNIILPCLLSYAAQARSGNVQ